MRYAATMAVAAVLLVGSVLRAEEQQNQQTATVGQPAPAFSLKDQNGRTVNLSDYSGKIIVLEWFNSECPFVQRHYKQETMKSLAQKYAGKDVVWLAINSSNDASSETDRQWAEQHKLSYAFLNDSSGTVGKQYGAKTTPHMFIIDRQGTLAYMGGIDNDPSGRMSADQRVNYVDKALGELTSGQPVSTPQAKPYGCSVKYGS